MLSSVKKTPFVAKRHRKPLNEATERVIKILARWQSGIYGEKVNKAEVKHTRIITGGGKKIQRQDALNEGAEAERKRSFE